MGHENIHGLPRAPPNIVHSQDNKLRPVQPLNNTVSMGNDFELPALSSEVPEIEIDLKENSELGPLTVNVRLPSTNQYELKMIPVNEIMSNTDPSSYLKPSEEVVEDPKTPSAIPKEKEEFTFHPNEIILDMKSVNLTCDQGTKGEYLCVSTTIPKPTGGEDEVYGARIIVFEILHDLAKVAEVNDKRCAAVVDSVRGYLMSNTEGPEMSQTTAGFKIQLYKLSRSKNKILDPNPTEPTKIMASKVSVMNDLVLFADIKKSFSIMKVKDQQNSFQPVLTRAFECFEDVTV